MTKLDESLLKNLPPFARLSPPQIREILDLATPGRHSEGASVFDEGLVAERFFLLLDGFIRVIRTTAHGEQIIALHIPPGQLFGIAPALGHTHYPATAVSASESLTLAWPIRLWPDFVAKYEGFADAVYKSVGNRVGEFQTQIADLATRAVEQRVASALVRLVGESGKRVENGVEIAFPITRSDISEMTGTTLHTVSRLLSAWERRGVLQSRRRHITVTDPHALVLLSGASG